jgi:predicted metal-dependent phosphoesterase TrpH
LFWIAVFAVALPAAVIPLWRGAVQASSQAAPRPSVVVTISGRREPGEAVVGTRAMKYLPFDVPEGVTRMTIHREFDHGPDTTRKNTVDFGLFDNRGTEKGFRGWQGGSPGDFVVTGDATTCSPHALPGPIRAGKWFLAQYYLVSVPAGLNYKYTVTFDFDGPMPPRDYPAPPRYEPGVITAKKGPGWYAGNLHAHTLHSDGGRTFPDMIGYNAAAGYDFVASTEHNTTTAHYRFPEAARAHPGVLLLYGNEFTSPGGHANIIGQTPGHWFDFRMDPGDKRLPRVIAEAHKQKAFVTVNHPYAPCTSCTWKYPAPEWRNADAIEVWNGKWTPDDAATLAMWDGLLKAGRRIHAVGGTDYHRGDDALSPATRVYAKNLSQPEIMDGLRKGHAYITESTKGPNLFLSSLDKTALPGDTVQVPGDQGVQIRLGIVGGNGKTLRLIWATGATTIPINADDTTVIQKIPTVAGQNSYVRAELRNPDDTPAALTNPIYMRDISR